MGMAWVRPGQQRGYNFVPFFPLTKKLDVNGKNADPIFKHLKVNLEKINTIAIKSKKLCIGAKITHFIFHISACMPSALAGILAR